MAGQPVPGGMGLQPAGTAVMEHIRSFERYTFWIVTAITVFVLALLVIVMVKFNAKSNPTPATFTHHTGLEIAWTLIPVLILVAIAIPSFRLLYEEVVIPKADMTVKVVGHTWYWEYEYPDHQNLRFDANLLEGADLAKKKDGAYLLSTDNELVVPVGKTVRVEVTAADVIHSWYVPSFGVQMYAIPGRLNETWFKAERPGIYYGQCNMICGARHAYMPIAIRVVSEEQFGKWVVEAKTNLNNANKLLADMLDAEAAKKVASR
ncbi:MAG: cytochrome c oxidase subunit II [Hyphomicrobiaceae bacterium]|nr:cytochrome c oxidase subunit II [Hyphomicrobiaceae bacterium]